jgi:hypothetical protein
MYAPLRRDGEDCGAWMSTAARPSMLTLIARTSTLDGVLVIALLAHVRRRRQRAGTSLQGSGGAVRRACSSRLLISGGSGSRGDCVRCRGLPLAPR